MNLRDFLKSKTEGISNPKLGKMFGVAKDTIRLFKNGSLSPKIARAMMKRWPECREAAELEIERHQINVDVNLETMQDARRKPLPVNPDGLSTYCKHLMGGL